MPYKLIFESPTTMWCQFSGHVDVTDLNNATNDFYNDYRSDHVTKALWDFMAMTHFDVGKEHTSEIAFSDNAASRYMKPMMAAFIVTDEEFSEIAKHYIEEMEKLESYWTNRLFSSLEDARDWVSAT
jgi:type IV secretory pathway VirD2 relaxase